MFLKTLYCSKRKKNVYSFREYLKRALKWQDYLAIYQQEELKHNA
ncbi:YpmP family protein [Bacillus haynesii]|nr:YpmP family protein [Bacillus haynesii]